MRLVQLRLPFRPALGVAAVRPMLATAPTTRPSGSAPSPAPLAAAFGPAGARFASVKAQGAYRVTNKKTIPKKLGAKRVGEQYVLPGTILYKQRGTIWHAGENALLGRDHTVHAAVAGYVKYYRDPARHPTRQYIGVAFKRTDSLPYPAQAPRQRRVGMVAVPIKAHATQPATSSSGLPVRVLRRPGVVEVDSDDRVDFAALDAEVETAKQAKIKADQEAVAAANEAARGTPAAAAKKTKASAAARRWNAYMRMKRTHRVLFLQKNYAYAESNVMIGRLMGMHNGHTPGTRPLGSRHGRMRRRRLNADAKRQTAREVARQQNALNKGKGKGGKKGKKAAAPAASKKDRKKKAKA